MDKKIFIIEDDANILYGLQAKLRVEGFDVEISTGADVMEMIMLKLKYTRPDFIILDLLLPNNDGFEILKSIKADDEIKNSKIIIFSSLSDADSRNRGLSLGADQYIAKSELTIDELTEKIKRIISNQKRIK